MPPMPADADAPPDLLTPFTASAAASASCARRSSSNIEGTSGSNRSEGADFAGSGDAIDGEEFTNEIPVLEERAGATQQTYQMCPIGADFKHFRAAKPVRISRGRQGLVNHASQGLVNHAGKSGV